VFVSSSDPQKLDWLEDEKDTLMAEVRAKSLLILRPEQKMPKAALEEVWRIEGQEFHMGLSESAKAG
jgi:hypothetical protein